MLIIYMYSYILILTEPSGAMFTKLVTRKDMLWSLPCPQGAKILYTK